MSRIVNPERQLADLRLRGDRAGGVRVTANGYRSLFWGDENILKLDYGDAYTFL